jgi:hypothetical protein
MVLEELARYFLGVLEVPVALLECLAKARAKSNHCSGVSCFANSSNMVINASTWSRNADKVSEIFCSSNSLEVPCGLEFLGDDGGFDGGSGSEQIQQDVVDEGVGGLVEVFGIDSSQRLLESTGAENRGAENCPFGFNGIRFGFHLTAL